MTPQYASGLDQLFKEGLTNAENSIVFRDEDWDAMEILLDGRKKRRGIIYFLPLILGSIAALLLLSLGFFFLKPDRGSDQTNPIARAKPPYQEIIKTDIQTPNPDGKTTTQPTAANDLSEHSLNNIAQVNRRPFSKSYTYRGIATGHGNQFVKNSIPVLADNPLVKDTAAETLAALGNQGSVLAKDSSVQQIISVIADKPQDTIPKVITPPAIKEQPKTTIKAIGFKHPVVLSIMAAPDFNGVGSSFSRAQMGTNAGLMLSFGVSRRLTISAGALYAKKPYNINFDQYWTSYNFKVKPTDVAADCRVLDIPLNIDYRLYSKGRNQFSIGTGISSYFMLRENYHFDYTGATALGPTDYDIKNQNKHLFGVLNLNANYQRRINEKFGVNIQPYMKLPLTDIGYGRVNLQSTGVAVGVSWYLNSSKR